MCGHMVFCWIFYFINSCGFLLSGSQRTMCLDESIFAAIGNHLEFSLNLILEKKLDHKNSSNQVKKYKYTHTYNEMKKKLSIVVETTYLSPHKYII